MAEVTWPRAPIQIAIFGDLNVLDSMLSSEGLKSLIVLLAYLEPKLWLKKWGKFYSRKH